jgi:tetratricopeptide (TPR) repeat protein
MRFFTLILYLTLSLSASDVYKEQRILQGELYISSAEEYYTDRLYPACIEKLSEFLFLYPNHPNQYKGLKLLSQAYLKNDQIEKSIEIDLKIYREFPTSETGLISYLDAGKKLILTGRIEEGKKILEEIKTQLYSYKIAKDAEIELRQMEVLKFEK